MQTEEETRRLIRQPPRRLRGPESAAAELAELTDGDPERTYERLRAFLLRGSDLRRSESSRFPIFAFRLHQFLTRGDTVWATIEPESARHLEISKIVAKPGEPEKTLFPLVFCRQCGTAYYRVATFTDAQGRGLAPREDRREEGDDVTRWATCTCRLSTPWPTGDGQALLNRLPAFMKETTADGTERIRADARGDVPEPCSSMQLAESSRGQGIPAALIRQNFLFCLEPSCGVAYTKSQRSERAKLATLGVDNRSTATTVLAVRALIELQSDRQLEQRSPQASELHRQPAGCVAASRPLQRLHPGRSAPFGPAQGCRRPRAQRAHPRRTLRSVFDALSLPFDEYAADPEVRGPARNATNDALRRVIQYYLYRDLQRRGA